MPTMNLYKIFLLKYREKPVKTGLVRFVDVSTTFVIALMKCFLYLTEFKYG